MRVNVALLAMSSLTPKTPYVLWAVGYVVYLPIGNSPLNVVQLTAYTIRICYATKEYKACCILNLSTSFLLDKVDVTYGHLYPFLQYE